MVLIEGRVELLERKEPVEYTDAPLDLTVKSFDEIRLKAEAKSLERRNRKQGKAGAVVTS